MRQNVPMSSNPNIGIIPSLTLGQRLRIAREYLGVEQQELAEIMGTSRQTVSAVERGVNQPRQLLIRAWAMATGVDREWLETGQQSTPPPSGDGADDPSRLRESNPRPIHYKPAVFSLVAA